MPTLEEKVDQLVKDMGEVKVALKGYDGSRGLINIVESHIVACATYRQTCQTAIAEYRKERAEDETKFRDDYYKLKRNIFMVAGFLVGSGVLGFGGYELAKLIMQTSL